MKKEITIVSALLITVLVMLLTGAAPPALEHNPLTMATASAVTNVARSMVIGTNNPGHLSEWSGTDPSTFSIIGSWMPTRGGSATNAIFKASTTNAVAALFYNSNNEIVGRINGYTWEFWNGLTNVAYITGQGGVAYFPQSVTAGRYYGALSGTNLDAGSVSSTAPATSLLTLMTNIAQANGGAATNAIGNTNGTGYSTTLHTPLIDGGTISNADFVIPGWTTWFVPSVNTLVRSNVYVRHYSQTNGTDWTAYSGGQSNLLTSLGMSIVGVSSNDVTGIAVNDLSTPSGSIQFGLYHGSGYIYAPSIPVLAVASGFTFTGPVTNSSTVNFGGASGVLVDGTGGQFFMKQMNGDDADVHASHFYGSSGDGAFVGSMESTNITKTAWYLITTNNGVVINGTIADQLFVTNASYTITGFSGIGGTLTGSKVSICVSNSAATSIVVTGPPTVRYFGGSSTNALTIPAGKQAYLDYDIRFNVVTNGCNVVEQ